MSDVEDQNETSNAPRGRSPAYPFLAFSKAMERAAELKEAEGFYAVPLSSVYTAWGISPKSSTSPQVVAALKHHNLVEYEGSGKTRSVKLTELARKILLDKRPDSKEREALIRQAALAPTIYREILNEYPDGLPSDATIETYLVLNRGFQEKAAQTLIPNLKDTIQFAQLDKMQEIPSDRSAEEESTERDPKIELQVGDLVDVEVDGQLVFPAPVRIRALQSDGGQDWVFVEGSESAVLKSQVTRFEGVNATSKSFNPPTLPLEKSALSPSAGDCREEKASLDEGEVILRWPRALSQESVEDLRYWLEGILRRAERQANQGDD